jgi:hypothetical protein
MQMRRIAFNNDILKKPVKSKPGQDAIAEKPRAKQENSVQKQEMRAKTGKRRVAGDGCKTLSRLRAAPCL